MTVEKKTVAISYTFNAIIPETSKKKYSAHTDCMSNRNLRLYVLTKVKGCMADKITN